MKTGVAQTKKVQIPRAWANYPVSILPMSEWLKTACQQNGFERLKDFAGETRESLKGYRNFGATMSSELFELCEKLKEEKPPKVLSATKGPKRYADLVLWADEALVYLRDDYREVLKMRLGAAHKKGSPLTLEEVGKHLGVTRQHVQQIEELALKRLQTILGSMYISLLEKWRVQLLKDIQPLDEERLRLELGVKSHGLRYNLNFYVRLLGHLDKKLPFWVPSNKPHSILQNNDKVGQALKKILADSSEWMTLKSLYKKLKTGPGSYSTLLQRRRSLSRSEIKTDRLKTEPNSYTTKFTVLEFLKAVARYPKIDLRRSATEGYEVRLLQREIPTQLLREWLNESKWPLSIKELRERARAEGFDLGPLKILHILKQSDWAIRLDYWSYGTERHLLFGVERRKRLLDQLETLLMNKGTFLWQSEAFKQLGLERKREQLEFLWHVKNDSRFKIPYQATIISLAFLKIFLLSRARAVEVLSESPRPLRRSEIARATIKKYGSPRELKRAHLEENEKIASLPFGYYTTVEREAEGVEYLISDESFVKKKIKGVNARKGFAMLCQKFGFEPEERNAQLLWQTFEKLKSK